jgi:hypothetical protein
MVPPKEHVTGFDGAGVALNLTVNELARFALGGGS